MPEKITVDLEKITFAIDHLGCNLCSLFSDGSIDVNTMRYLSRYINLLEIALVTNKRKINLKDIGISVKKERRDFSCQ